MTVPGREDTELLVRLSSAIGLFAALSFDASGARASEPNGRQLEPDRGLAASAKRNSSLFPIEHWVRPASGLPGSRSHCYGVNTWIIKVRIPASAVPPGDRISNSTVTEWEPGLRSVLRYAAVV
jgi:hypothetical protein